MFLHGNVIGVALTSMVYLTVLPANVMVITVRTKGFQDHSSVVLTQTLSFNTVRQLHSEDIVVGSVHTKMVCVISIFRFATKLYSKSVWLKSVRLWRKLKLRTCQFTITDRRAIMIFGLLVLLSGMGLLGGIVLYAIDLLRDIFTIIVNIVNDYVKPFFKNFMKEMNNKGGDN